jgi:hypothetical protein
MKEEQFIEHEIQLRVNDERIKWLENGMDEIRGIYKITMGAFITSVLLPVILHWLRVV